MKTADLSREQTDKLLAEIVVVTAKAVSSPTQVQFGWHNLADPNLTNKAGLPASPFQTNNWLGDTGE